MECTPHERATESLRNVSSSDADHQFGEFIRTFMTQEDLDIEGLLLPDLKPGAVGGRICHLLCCWGKCFTSLSLRILVSGSLWCSLSSKDSGRCHECGRMILPEPLSKLGLRSHPEGLRLRGKITLCVLPLVLLPRTLLHKHPP